MASEYGYRIRIQVQNPYTKSGYITRIQIQCFDPESGYEYRYLSFFWWLYGSESGSGSVSVLGIWIEYLYSCPDSGSKYHILIQVTYPHFVLGFCNWILIRILYLDSIFEFGICYVDSISGFRIRIPYPDSVSRFCFVYPRIQVF